MELTNVNDGKHQQFNPHFETPSYMNSNNYEPLMHHNNNNVEHCVGNQNFERPVNSQMDQNNDYSYGNDINDYYQNDYYNSTENNYAYNMEKVQDDGVRSIANSPIYSLYFMIFSTFKCFPRNTVW